MIPVYSCSGGTTPFFGEAGICEYGRGGPNEHLDVLLGNAMEVWRGCFSGDI